MFGELETFVAMVHDAPIRQLLESIMNDVSISERLKTAAAAMKIHHSYVPSLERQLFRGFGEQPEPSERPETIEGGKAA